jgi:hypothetical protein
MGGAIFNDDELDDDFDEDDDEFFDCAMTSDGQCMKAGSEECDFECPIMADIRRAELRRKEKAK